LDVQVKEFGRQAGEVREWDRVLVENGNQVSVSSRLFSHPLLLPQHKHSIITDSSFFRPFLARSRVSTPKFSPPRKPTRPSRTRSHTSNHNRPSSETFSMDTRPRRTKCSTVLEEGEELLDLISVLLMERGRRRESLVSVFFLSLPARRRFLFRLSTWEISVASKVRTD